MLQLQNHRTAAAYLLKFMIKFKIKFEIKFEIIVKLKLKANQIQETSMASASGYSGDAVNVPIPQDSSSSIVAFTTFNETNENEMKT